MDLDQILSSLHTEQLPDNVNRTLKEFRQWAGVVVAANMHYIHGVAYNFPMHGGASAKEQISLDYLLKDTELDSTSKAWLSQSYTRQKHQNSNPPQPSLTLAHTDSDELDLPKASLPPQINYHSDSFDFSFDNFTSWEFDVFDLQHDHMLYCITNIFQREGLMRYARLEKNPEIFAAFLTAVQTGYRDNQFHNFRHGLDVFLNTYTMCQSKLMKKFLTKRELFIILISALIHDLDHPGLTNAFMINSGSPMALLYNDISVIESHSCTFFFGLVKEKTQNIFYSFRPSEFTKMRSMVISLILASDNANHFDMLQDCSRVLDMWEAEIGMPVRSSIADTPIPDLRDESRLTILSTVLHSADIANPCKPWEISNKWSDCLVEEFFAQGDREKAEGLSVSPNCDRDSTDQSQLTLNFIDFIAAPQFMTLNRLLAEAGPWVKQLVDNRKRWEDKINQAEWVGDDVWRKRSVSFHNRVRGSITESGVGGKSQRSSSTQSSGRMMLTPRGSRDSQFDPSSLPKHLEEKNEDHA